MYVFVLLSIFRVLRGFARSPLKATRAPTGHSYELKSDDIVKFGFDIIGEDKLTIIRRKVAAPVVCVFSDQDALVAVRADQHQQQHHQLSQHPSTSSLSSLSSSNLYNGAWSGAGGRPRQDNSRALSFSFAQGSGGNHGRRPPMQPVGLGGMGGRGANVRLPGKSGLTFDHILKSTARPAAEEP
jgi:hypothetical protein